MRRHVAESMNQTCSAELCCTKNSNLFFSCQKLCQRNHFYWFGLVYLFIHSVTYVTLDTQPNSITRQEQYGCSLCHVDGTPGHPPSCLQCPLIYFLTFPTHNYPSILPAILENHFMCSLWLHKLFLSLGLGILGSTLMICVPGLYWCCVVYNFICISVFCLLSFQQHHASILCL